MAGRESVFATGVHKQSFAPQGILEHTEVILRSVASLLGVLGA
jgi:hypothetical protein